MRNNIKRRITKSLLIVIQYIYSRLKELKLLLVGQVILREIQKIILNIIFKIYIG